MQNSKNCVGPTLTLWDEGWFSCLINESINHVGVDRAVQISRKSHDLRKLSICIFLSLPQRYQHESSSFCLGEEKLFKKKRFKKQGNPLKCQN